MPSSAQLTQTASIIEFYIMQDDPAGISRSLQDLYPDRDTETIADEVARIVLSEEATEIELSVFTAIATRVGYRRASARQAARELRHKAHYALKAFSRLVRAKDKAQAAKNETRYHAQQIAFSKRRQEKARAADNTFARFGGVAGWYGYDDDRVDPECKEKIGTNIHESDLPSLLPGMVHGGCRCWIGPPHKNKR